MRAIAKWVAVLAMAVAFPASTFAAEAPTSTRLMVTIYHLKPGKVDAWIKARQDTVMPALKKAGIPWITTSEQIFGDRPVYTTIRPLTSFSELDGPGPLLRSGLTQKQVDAFNAITDDATVSVDRFIVNTQTEFSIPATGPAPVSILTVLRPNPGQGEALRDLVRSSLLPAMRAAKQAGTIAGFSLSTTAQGRPGLMVLSVSQPNLAALDNGNRVIASMSEAQRELFLMQLWQIAVQEDLIVNRQVAELSYAPAN